QGGRALCLLLSQSPPASRVLERMADDIQLGMAGWDGVGHVIQPLRPGIEAGNQCKAATPCTLHSLARQHVRATDDDVRMKATGIPFVRHGHPDSIPSQVLEPRTKAAELDFEEFVRRRVSRRRQVPEMVPSRALQKAHPSSSQPPLL